MAILRLLDFFGENGFWESVKQLNNHQIDINHKEKYLWVIRHTVHPTCESQGNMMNRINMFGFCSLEIRMDYLAAEDKLKLPLLTPQYSNVPIHF